MKPLPQLAGYLQPLSNNHDGLHIAFLKSADIESHVKNTLARKHDVIVATGFGSESGKGTLYST